MNQQAAFEKALRESGGTELEFFQSAYIRVFNKAYNCVRDVIEYRRTKELPAYVVKFLELHCA